MTLDTSVLLLNFVGKFKYSRCSRIPVPFVMKEITLDDGFLDILKTRKVNLQLLLRYRWLDRKR